MNKHIEENLKCYISQKDPEYAILLSGKWGSGKTYFIDNFIKTYNNDNSNENCKNQDVQFIKVSLFGLKNIDSIDEQIFQELHPILGSKYAKFAGNIFKGALKFGINIDIDGDNKSDGKASIDLKSLNIFSKDNDKSSSKELIFIFDDLERTNIELSEILGYINYFVEQSNFKVIILANEEKVKEYDKDEKFKEFKEKVIGKTYEVQQNFETVFNNFLDLSIHSKEILEQNSSNIKELYIKSTYNNLRHIRQAIMDFDYLYNLLNNKYKEHSIFINKFIYVFFALSMERRKGILIEEEFKSNNFISWNFSSDKEEKKEKTEFEKILTKYTLTGYDSLLLETNTWINILFKNYLIKEDINKAISQISYFNYETYESWHKLYRYWALEDTEYDKVLKDVINKFNNNEYLEHEKLLSVFGLLSHLSKNNLCDISQTEITKQTKKNIIDNCQSELWKTKGYMYSNHHDGYTYNGTIYSYYDNESNDFINMQDYLKEESQKSFNVGLKVKANDLLLDFQKNNLDNIDKKLNEDFRKIDIFNYIDKVDLQDAILRMMHDHLPTLTSILENRYEVWQLTNNHQNFVNELTLWAYINSNILTSIDKDIMPLKYNLISSFTKNHTNKIVSNIKEAIETLNKDLEVVKL